MSGITAKQRDWIHLNAVQLSRATDALAHITDGVETAAKRATRRALRAAIAEAAKQTPKKYNVTQKTVRDSFTVSNVKISSGTISGKVVSRGSGLPLINFKVQPKTLNPRRKGQLNISVTRGNNSVIPGAFIARVRGKVGVYRRLNTYASAKNHYYLDGKGRRREEIRQQYGISVPQMLGNEKIAWEIARAAREKLDERFDHEVQRIFFRGKL